MLATGSIKFYVPNSGIGTVAATLLPNAFVFFRVWTLPLIVWLSLGIPEGPRAPLQLAG